MQGQYREVMERAEQAKRYKEEFKGFGILNNSLQIKNPYTALMFTHAGLFPFNKRMTYFVDIRFI